MTEVKKAQQGAFLSRLASTRDVLGLLVFGNDTGGVRELAQKAIRLLLGDALDDPFALVQLDEEMLKEDPGRQTWKWPASRPPGGRRVIRVRNAGNAFRDSMRPVLGLEATEAVIVAEAPGLKKDSALAKLFTKEKRLAALPVYADDASDVQRLIDEVLGAHGLSIDRDARLALAPLLGADRLASRNELEKLALYCRGRGQVTLQDVRDVCSDMSAHMMQDMLDAFLTGQAEEGLRLFSALLAEGTPGAAMLQAAANHVARLKVLRAAMSGGLNAREAVARARPPIFFRRRPIVERQLGLWSASALARADESLWQAMRQARCFAELEAAIAERALLTLALKSAGGRRAA